MAWKVEPRSNWYCIYDEMGWYVAGCQSERQAQLIANAPEMMKALEAIAKLELGIWCQEHEEERLMCHCCYDIATAAIAAVKGESGEDELV